MVVSVVLVGVVVVLVVVVMVTVVIVDVGRPLFHAVVHVATSSMLIPGMLHL